MSPRNKNNAIDVWLKKEIESGKHKGLRWIDQNKQKFVIPWMHASRRQWQIENDATLYKSWAKCKNRYKEGDENKPRVWKATFRNAINASKYIKFEDKKEPNVRFCTFIKPNKEKLENTPATTGGNSQASETRKQTNSNKLQQNITCKNEFTSPHSFLEDSEDRRSPKTECNEAPVTSFESPPFQLSNNSFSEVKYQPETHQRALIKPSVKLKEESEKPNGICMQVASVNVSKWNTSSYGYQHLNSYGEYYPIGDEDFQLADSFAECAINNDISNNFNTNALGLMEGENHSPDFLWLTQAMIQQRDNQQLLMSCWNNEMEPPMMKMERNFRSQYAQMPINMSC